MYVEQLIQSFNFGARISVPLILVVNFERSGHVEIILGRRHLPGVVRIFVMPALQLPGGLVLGPGTFARPLADDIIAGDEMNQQDQRSGTNVASASLSGYWMAIDLGSSSPSTICSPVSSSSMLVTASE